MKRNSKLVAAAFLSGSIGLNGLFPQDTLTATVPEPGSAPEVVQTQPLPGQPGTIPERIQPPDARGEQEMVISEEEIKRAQEALKAKGYDPGAVSGRMHAKTQEALREFQKKNNLPATGVLDKKTADKLGVTVPER
jgi:peptidoglycan hydrolase-like protein with peptidoglycan-binding domain